MDSIPQSQQSRGCRSTQTVRHRHWLITLCTLCEERIQIQFIEPLLGRMQAIKIENEDCSEVFKAYGPYVSVKLFGIKFNDELVVNCKIIRAIEL